MTTVTTTTFDTLLACLFPLAICIAAYRLRDSLGSFSDLRALVFPTKSSSQPYFSLERAYHSYRQYERLSKSEVSRMRASYSKLGRAHKRMANTLGYTKKLDRLWDITALNGTIADEIAEIAEREYPSVTDTPKYHATSADLARVREALKHFIRDWSDDGAKERHTIFSPILDCLKTVDPELRASQKVLVPGCGLGRLSWEISQLGFDTAANELSYYMVLAFRLLLSTGKCNEHKLRPFAHWWSHQRTNESLFRGISFPDALPKLSSKFRLIEGDFLKITPPSESPEPDFKYAKDPDNYNKDGYHFIVTLFFIDTSTNILDTLEHIYRLLRPGGSWINLGPLLWTGGGQCSLELSLDEVLAAAEQIGFVIQNNHGASGHPEAPRTVECEYTGDADAMMRFTYKAQYWVARKWR